MDMELLRKYYPSLRQYYRFLATTDGRATKTGLRSGLLKTWDYFYNSGGWDDYPPQVYVHQNKLEDSAAPVANTAHGIRTARILSFYAEHLGFAGDMAEYENDAEKWLAAIDAYAWDEASGYYGYTLHDRHGYPAGILRYEDGSNYNCGLDGLYPLVAGLSDRERIRKLASSLMDNRHQWTSIGITAVDQNAPYYNPNGYWNGTIWMAHQWFFWKALLDYGCTEEAFKIAGTALDLWTRETARSGNCYEHFHVESGRGAGWHQFTSLSSPILIWFGAYHVPGHVSFGFDLHPTRVEFSSSLESMSAEFLIRKGKTGPVSLIVVLRRPEKDIGRKEKCIHVEGGNFRSAERMAGTFEITVDAIRDRTLTISIS
jgi:hypothetical protein